MECFWKKTWISVSKIVRKNDGPEFYKGLKTTHAIKFSVCRFVFTPNTSVKGLHSFSCLRSSPLVLPEVTSHILPKCLVFWVVLMSAPEMCQLSKGERRG